MRRTALLVAALSLTPLGFAAAPALAQDVGPALDMGQLTGSLAQDHITQSERARAARRRGPTARQRQACANLPRFRAEYGAGNPQVGHLTSLCRRAGLPVQ